MKTLRIQAVFLALVIVMPLVTTSFTLIEDKIDMYEMSEESGSKEQKDERESEKKEGKDAVEEYLLHDQYALFTIGDQSLEFYVRSNKHNSVSTDVLTPPPEFI